MVATPAARRSRAIMPWLVGLLLALPSAALSGPRDPGSLLVPAPAHTRVLSGTATLDSSWSIVLADSTADFPGANLLARDVLRTFGWTWRIRTTRPMGPAILLSQGPVAAPVGDAAQGYSLSIAPRLIRITGSTPQGRFYGLQTLRQLLRQSPEPELSCLVITDAPSLEWRGVSDDISRGQISTLADFRGRLEEFAYYKINLVFLYIEDVFGGAPGVPDALAPEELALIARAAERYHIRLVPVFQTFGYTPSIVRALSSGPDRPGLPAGGSQPRALPFTSAALGAVLQKVDDLATSCPAPWFHIGGDELGNFGLTEPAASRISGDGQTHLAYASLLSNHLKARHGRSTLVYGDFVKHFALLRDSLDRTTIVVDWNYYPDGDFGTTRRLRAAGFDSVLVSPGLWNWTTFYPDYRRAFTNVAAFIDSGRAAGALGSVTSAWGDNGSESLRSYNSAGYAFGAAASWEARAPDAMSFLRRYSITQFGVESADIVEAHRLIGWRQLGFDYIGRVFHAPPHVRVMGGERSRQMLELRDDMVNALERIRRGRRACRFNGLQLDELEQAARRWHYLATKDLVMEEIARDLQETPGPASQAKAAARLGALRDELGAIAGEFEKFWRVRNKPSGLEANMQRLRRQMDEISRLEAYADSGELSVWLPGLDPQ